MAVQENHSSATWLKEQDFVCLRAQQVPVKSLLLEVPFANHTQLARYLAIRTAVDRGQLGLSSLPFRTNI